MLRSFSHEFTHFIEKWSPALYNELRAAVFEEMEAKGRNTDELIKAEMERNGLSYEMASREVIAESMTDALQDASFVENLAQEHKSLFEKLWDELKKFVSDIRAAYGLMRDNEVAYTAELKDEAGRYIESLLNIFDRAAEDAARNSQAAKPVKQGNEKVAVAENVTATVEPKTAGYGDEAAETPGTEGDKTKTERKTTEAAQEPAEAQEAAATAVETEAAKETASGIQIAKGPSARSSSAKGVAHLLASKISELQDMEPVASLSGHEMNEKAKLPSQQIVEFFQRVGGKIFRRKFGEVVLGQYGVDGVINHKPLNRAKMVSLVAVPEVLKHGKLISDVDNWKGRGYRSFVFAAPVTIGTDTVFVAAVVDQIAENQFYLNECVDSEGNYVRITESPSGNTKNGFTVQDGLTIGPEELSDNSISETSEKSNSEKAENKAVEEKPVDEAKKELPFDKKLDRMMRNAEKDVYAGEADGQYYISDAVMLLPTTKAGAEYAAGEDTYKAKDMNVASMLKRLAEGKTFAPVTTAPVFHKGAKGELDLYIFTMPDGTQFALQKKYVDYFDGGRFSAAALSSNKFTRFVKVENADGEVMGYVMTALPQNRKDFGPEMANAVPSNLKSFRETGKKNAPAKAENKAETPEEVQYSKKKDRPDEHITITREMTDQERYEALKNRKISLNAKVNYDVLATAEKKLGQKTEAADILSMRERKVLFRAIGREFEVFKQYSNEDIKISFSFGTSNLRHSLAMQQKNFQDFVKLLSCFEATVENAVGIEVHNRNDEGYKPDVTLKNVYVLVSAFEDGKRIVPVKFEIKEFSDKENTLYVAVALDSIKKDEVDTEGIFGIDDAESDVAQAAHSSIISISNLFRKINPEDTSFLKYVPQQFLTEDVAQYQLKRKGYSDTDLLEMAADGFGKQELTEAERDALRIVNERIAKLRQLQTQREELGALYREQQFGMRQDKSRATVDRAEAVKTLNRMGIVDEQIRRAETSILRAKDAETVKGILRAAKDEVRSIQAAADKAAVARMDERREAAYIRKKILLLKDRANAMITNPKKGIKGHVPTALLGAVATMCELVNQSQELYQGRLQGNLDVRTATDETEAAKITKRQAQLDKMKLRLRELSETYKNLKEEFGYDEHVAELLADLETKLVGVDIVLTNDAVTGTDAVNGREIFTNPQGKFNRKDGKIYIAVNAGLYYTSDVENFAKYTMLRSFCHEFTHFIEEWSPAQYQELRGVVFDTLTQQGKNVHNMIEQVRAQSEGLSYDAASREVVAEAMTDILPDSHFIETIAAEHQPLYKRILSKLREFSRRLMEAWRGMQQNPSEAANALKAEINGTVRYLDSIIQAFDKAAVAAAENYQDVIGVERTASAPAVRAESKNQSRKYLKENENDGDGVQELHGEDKGERQAADGGEEGTNAEGVPGAENKGKWDSLGGKEQKRISDALGKHIAKSKNYDELTLSVQMYAEAASPRLTLDERRLGTERLAAAVYEAELVSPIVAERDFAYLGDFSDIHRAMLGKDYDSEEQHQSRKSAKPETRSATASYEGRDMVNDGGLYSYEFLTAQKKMLVSEMPSLSEVKNGEKVSPSKAVNLGMKNAASIGRKVGDIYAITNDYTKKEIHVSRSSLSHSLHTDLTGSNIGRLRTNSRLSAIGGEIVQHAIPINSLKNKNPQAAGTYAMAALLKSNEKNVVAIVTVEQQTNPVVGIECADMAHSISGRLVKENAGDNRSSTREKGFKPTTVISDSVSISDFLGIVNGTYRSILSENVLQALNEERPAEGYYADRVQYQERQRGYTDAELLEKYSGQVREAGLTPAERDALDIYERRVGKLKELEQRRDDIGEPKTVREKQLLKELDKSVEQARIAVKKAEAAVAIRQIIGRTYMLYAASA